MVLILEDFSMMTMGSLLGQESHNGCGLVQVFFMLDKLREKNRLQTRVITFTTCKALKNVFQIEHDFKINIIVCTCNNKISMITIELNSKIKSIVYTVSVQLLILMWRRENFVYHH